MHQTTQRIIDDLANNKSIWIAPVTYSACYPRQFVSAAFRIAKHRGIIEQTAISVDGTPIYRRPLKLSN